MSFANFKMEELNEIGIQALEDKVEFSEFSLLTENLERVCKGIVGLEMVKVVQAKDCSQSEVQSVKNSQDNVRPRNPIITIDF